MKKKFGIPFLVALIPLFATWGFPMLPDSIQIIFRVLTVLGIVALFVLLMMLYRENSTLRKQRNEWKRVPPGTIISKTQINTDSDSIIKITKEVKKP